MNWILIHKYLLNECTPKEKQEVEAWLRSDIRNREYMDSLNKIWEVEPDDEIEINAKSAWRVFQHKIPPEEPARQEQPVYTMDRLRVRSAHLTPKPRKRYGRSIALSLSAAAVIVIAVLFYHFMPQVGSGTQPEMYQIATERGQRTIFRLLDGTQVQLNADSKITIPPEFGDSTRSVYLEGEAYFEVTHNPEVPFIVHSGAAYTKVLGTKFGVRAYPGGGQIQVAVAEGRVALGSSGLSGKTEKHITKNQVGLLTANGEVKVHRVANIQRYLGWKDGRLVFKSTPLKEVIPLLERWYDIEMAVADSSLNALKLTASFRDEPMTEVMNIIALSLDLEKEREGRKITFYSH